MQPANKQQRSFTNRLRDLAELIERETHPDAFDRALRSLQRFHSEPDNADARQRPWNQVSPRLVTREQVQGMSPEVFAAHLADSRQIELPIQDYSVESGEALRIVLPSLARFMGKSRAQNAFGAEQGDPWCAATWCAEERRHAAIFGRLVEQLTDAHPVDLPRRSPAQLEFDERSAIAHLIDRGAAEWAASSSYFIYALHAREALREILLNVIRDELKHLAIFSAADRYLLGPRGAARVLDLIHAVSGLRRNNLTEPLPKPPRGTVALQLFSFARVQWNLSRWLSTLTPGKLIEVFEVPSQLKPLAELPLSSGAAAARDTAIAAAAVARKSLARWARRATGS